MGRARFAAAFLYAGMLVGCVQRVPTELVSAVRVESGPVGAPIGDTGAPAFLGEGPLIKITFESDEVFAELASEPNMQLRFDFFVCRARDQYTHSGNIYGEAPGVYAAYIPARFDELTYWVTGGGSGEIGRGWPDELADDPLCLTVRGGIPYASRVRGQTMSLPMEVHDLFEEDQNQ